MSELYLLKIANIHTEEIIEELKDQNLKLTEILDVIKALKDYSHPAPKEEDLIQYLHDGLDILIRLSEAANRL